MRPTLYQLRQQREREAKAKNVARLLDRCDGVLARADAEGQRDLTPHEHQQIEGLLARVQRINGARA